MMGRGGPASKIALCGDACGCINRYLPGKCLQGIQKWEACSRKSREMPARNSKTETVQSEEQGNACKEFKNGNRAVGRAGKCLQGIQKRKPCSRKSWKVPARNSKTETVQSEEQGNACKEIKNGKLTVKNQGELRSEPGKGKIDSKESRGITVRTGKREN